FIVIEGIEGSGKSTLIQGLEQSLNAEGREIVRTREPGATAIGTKIRSILLDSENTKLDPKAELMLFFADRAQHNSEVIRPALKRGATVICDRYSFSTLAYQGYGRGLELEILEQISSFINEDLKPSAVLLLDLPPEVGLARAESWNRFEEEELNFHSKIRQGFIELSAKSELNWLLVDATAPAETILAKSLNYLASLSEGN
ncbi:UNVERIFIED_CONTAM: hypothetical protein GTU68_017855, partial [Idotea baltica]|nr:hypothetical protein [Idotea baltica]